jgi:hypothetical protein
VPFKPELRAQNFLHLGQLHRIYEKEFARASYEGPLNYYKVAVSADELEDGKSGYC